MEIKNFYYTHGGANSKLLLYLTNSSTVQVLLSICLPNIQGRTIQIRGWGEYNKNAEFLFNIFSESFFFSSSQMRICRLAAFWGNFPIGKHNWKGGTPSYPVQVGPSPHTKKG